MAKASQPLLDKLDELNAKVLDVISDVTPDELEVPSAEENWPLGLLISHIGNGYRNSAHWIGSIIAGQPLIITGQDIGEANDRAEAAYTRQSGEELVANLKENIDALTRFVDGLSEEQLALKQPMALIGGKEASPFTIVKILQNHTLGHLDSFKMTLASVRDEVTS